MLGLPREVIEQSPWSGGVEAKASQLFDVPQKWQNRFSAFCKSRISQTLGPLVKNSRTSPEFFKSYAFFCDFPGLKNLDILIKGLSGFVQTLQKTSRKNGSNNNQMFNAEVILHTLQTILDAQSTSYTFYKIQRKIKKNSRHHCNTAFIFHHHRHILQLSIILPYLS